MRTLYLNNMLPLHGGTKRQLRSTPSNFHLYLNSNNTNKNEKKNWAFSVS
jgi:hypothetical protein